MFLPFSNSNKYLAKSKLTQKPSKRTIFEKYGFFCDAEKNKEIFCKVVTQKQLQEWYFRPCQKYAFVITFTEKSCPESIKKIPIKTFKRGSIFVQNLHFIAYVSLGIIKNFKTAISQNIPG